MDEKTMAHDFCKALISANDGLFAAMCNLNDRDIETTKGWIIGIMEDVDRVLEQYRDYADAVECEAKDGQA